MANNTISVNIPNLQGHFRLFTQHKPPIKQQPIRYRFIPKTVKLTPEFVRSLSPNHHQPPNHDGDMSPAIDKSSRIRHIVRVRQMLCRWRRRATTTSSSSSSSSRRLTTANDVPAGHVAICVGSGCRRFIVRATYLNHPVFQKLLREAEEEYGFCNKGPLTIPCDESEFEEILRFVSRPELDSGHKTGRLVNCHVGYVAAESKPLLHGSVY